MYSSLLLVLTALPTLRFASLSLSPEAFILCFLVILFFSCLPAVPVVSFSLPVLLCLSHQM